MGVFRLIYIIIFLCYLVHSPVMSQAFEDCKGDPSCESNYCTKYPTDPSCGSSTTFPDCNGDPDCNAQYTKSCESDPKQDICKTATTTTTSESSGDFEACKGDPSCNETCTKNPSDPMCGATSETSTTTETSTSPDSGEIPILEETSPAEDSYVYDPNNVNNPPPSFEACKGNPSCEGDYCVANPGESICSSMYPSPDSDYGLEYTSPGDSFDSFYNGSSPSIGDNSYGYDDGFFSFEDPSISDGQSEINFSPPDYASGSLDGSFSNYTPPDESINSTDTTSPDNQSNSSNNEAPQNGDSIIGNESAFYVSQEETPDQTVSIEEIYGSLPQVFKQEITLFTGIKEINTITIMT